jgi:uncharacterized protein
MSADHPCLSCGACCAFERVLFHRDHVEPAGLVPAWLVVPAVVPNHVRARGTVGPDPRCAALEGAVGERVRCGIYERRPPPCRDYGASFEDGRCNPFCDRPRAAHGMAPLTAESWR